MPEFIADTAGTVHGCKWGDLAGFTRGYIEAMLFTETAGSYSMIDWDSPETQEALEDGTSDGNIPGDAGFGDIHPDSFAALQIDCMNFESQAGHILREVYARGEYDNEAAGRDFWYTRNGHGTGFWDRKALEKPDAYASFGSPRVGDPGWSEYIADREDSPGNKLTEIARTFGQVDVSFEPDPDSPTGYGYVYIS